MRKVDHFSAGTRPALLILELSNHHLMVTNLYRAPINTLDKLNRWYGRFFDALALLQKGDLDWIEGRGVIAMHRDLGGNWSDHQPCFYRTINDVLREGRDKRINHAFWHGLPGQEGWAIITL